MSPTPVARGRVPLYFQIETVLRERIRSGRYASASPFPTEEALQQEFSVSRGTVRLALASLRREGLIVSYPGRGAFVTVPAQRPRTLRFGGSLEELIAHGSEIDFVVTTSDPAAASAIEAQELKIPEGAQVVRIAGLRLHGEQRVAHVAVSLPETLGVLLQVRTGEPSKSIAGLLIERLGQTVREARQVVAVAVANEAMAAALAVPVGSPLLEIRRTYYSADGTPVEFAVSSYPGDKYQYESMISTGTLS